MSPIIEAKNVTKTFKDFTAVNDISFSVEKGEIFAFLGPNGAGKTTTIKMLTTLLRPTKGEVMIDGHNPVHDQSAARRAFGIVFQDPSLDGELTAKENMELHAALYSVPRAGRAAHIQELLTFVELWDRKDSLVKEFSGGMKRRLEIARSLLHHPKVLFLDEPTIGLDPQTRNHLWDYVQKLNKEEGITVFLTTHYMEEAAKVATRIAIIDHGTIIAVGSSADLQKQTETTNLEDAFLKLTGNAIRDEAASSAQNMRDMRRAWGRH
ncbi:ATP-binding cassette domain-containing protein [Candidatus Peribacteria bacterium]|nr:MAG: ATP-binding cassette domain-containing protein [Candidatus Peribacteria bacterium]